MKTPPVEIVPAVLDLIREQMIYISKDSINNAILWEDRVMATIRGLADFHGHMIDSDVSNHLGYPVHKLVFERTYLIYYQVDEAANVIRVVHFRHGARLPFAGK